MLRTLGAFVTPDSAIAAGTPALSSAEALVAAMQSVGMTITTGAITSTLNGTRETLSVNDSQIRGPVSSTLVYFPLSPGVVTLAYEQFTFTHGPGDYLTIGDASTGGAAVA